MHCRYEGVNKGADGLRERESKSDAPRLLTKGSEHVVDVASALVGSMCAYEQW